MPCSKQPCLIWRAEEVLIIFYHVSPKVKPSPPGGMAEVAAQIGLRG